MQRYGVFSEDVVIPGTKWSPNRLDIQRYFVFNPASCASGGPPIQSGCYRASIPTEGNYFANNEDASAGKPCNPCEDFSLPDVKTQYFQPSTTCPYFYYNRGNLKDSASLMCIDSMDEVWSSFFKWHITFLCTLSIIQYGFRYSVNFEVNRANESKYFNFNWKGTRITCIVLKVLESSNWLIMLTGLCRVFL